MPSFDRTRTYIFSIHDIILRARRNKTAIIDTLEQITNTVETFIEEDHSSFTL